MADKTYAPKITLPIGDDVRAAIEAGDVLMTTAEVKVGNVYVPYDKLTAVTVTGALALAGGKGDQEPEKDDQGNTKKDEDGNPLFKRGSTVAGEFTYGFDLSRRAKVRQQHEQAAEGPAKALDRAVADLIKLGFSEEDAKRIVASSPAAASK